MRSLPQHPKSPGSLALGLLENLCRCDGSCREVQSLTSLPLGAPQGKALLESSVYAKVVGNFKSTSEATPIILGRGPAGGRGGGPNPAESQSCLSSPASEMLKPWLCDVLCCPKQYSQNTEVMPAASQFSWREANFIDHKIHVAV